MASYVTKEFQIRFHRPYPNNLVNKLKRRDLRILVIAVGAAVGHPLVALLAIGSLTHIAVFQILASVWNTTARPSLVLTPRPKRAQSLETVLLDANVGATATQGNGATAAVSPTRGAEFGTPT